MVDTLVLETSVERRVGSTPTLATNFKYLIMNVIGLYIILSYLYNVGVVFGVTNGFSVMNYVDFFMLIASPITVPLNMGLSAVSEDEEDDFDQPAT